MVIRELDEAKGKNACDYFLLQDLSTRRLQTKRWRRTRRNGNKNRCEVCINELLCKHAR
jgi:hypothetical protein